MSEGKRYVLQPASKSNFKDKSMTLLKALEKTDLDLHILNEEVLDIEFADPGNEALCTMIIKIIIEYME